MLNNISKKICAFTLAALCFSLPLSNIAAAASHVDHNTTLVQELKSKVEHSLKDNRDHDRHSRPGHYESRARYERHEKYGSRYESRHHEKYTQHKKKSSSGKDKLIGGLIIGTVIGAIIANNNKDN